MKELKLFERNFKTFLINLEISKPERVRNLCAEFEKLSYNTLNSNKAINEVEELVFNKSYDLVQRYYNNFTKHFDTLTEIEQSEKFEGYLIMHIKIALIEVTKVYKELEEFAPKKNIKKNIVWTMQNAKFKNHEKLYDAVIFSANENENKGIEGAYYLIKKVWFFVNSDEATFNGKKVEKHLRPLHVNPSFFLPDFKEFFESKITYNSKQDNIILLEQDLIIDLVKWIENRSEDVKLSIPRKRKLNEFLEYLNNKSLQPQQTENKKVQNSERNIKLNAKHYVLAYLFDCNVKGESYPVGKKTEIEKIGFHRTKGKIKGNTFYKNFNEIMDLTSFDLNKEDCLIEFCGDNWREIILSLSEAPEKLEIYLQDKKL